MGRADLSAILLHCTSAVGRQWAVSGPWGEGLGPNDPTCFPRDVAQVGEAGIWQTLCAVLLSFAAAFCTTCVPWM